MVYGTGVEGNQSSAPNVGIANRSQHSDFGFADSVANVFRRKQLENETVLTSANEQKILADKLLSQARYLETMQNVARLDATFSTYVDKAKADLDHTRQSIEESKQRVDESVQRTHNLTIQASQLKYQVDYWKAHAENEANEMPALLRARAYQAMQSGNLSAAQIGVAHSLVKLNDAKIQELLQMVENLKLDGGNKAIEYEINSRMNDIGMSGIKPKDLLVLLKDLVMQLIK